MNHLKHPMVISFLSLLALPFCSWADYGNGGSFISTAGANASLSSGSSSSSSTTTAINNLAQWMGYPLPGTTAPQPVNPPYTMNSSNITTEFNQLVESEYGAAFSYFAQTPLIVNSGQSSSLVPSSYSNFSAPYSIVNTVPAAAGSATGASNVWSNYTTPSSSTISVIPNVDLPSGNQVSTNALPAYPCNTIGCELVYSLLTMPSYTVCTEGGLSSTIPNAFPWYPGSDNCPFYAYNLSAVSTLLGLSSTSEGNDTVLYGMNTASASTTVPTPGNMSTYLSNNIANMNAEVLMQPLAYNTTQANNVNHFIHTLTGSLLMSLPVAASSYNTTYQNMLVTGNPALVNQSIQSIFSYLLNLKSLGAFLSIGLSDFDYIASRRQSNNQTGTSAAFDESLMATRRLFNTLPTGSSVPNNQWNTDMQNASPIVLMREMVMLQAEMNYQLYLSRMQDEKILLTLAAMQLANVSSMAPSIAMSLQSSTTPSNSTTSSTS